MSTIVGIDLSTTCTGLCVDGETFSIRPLKKATLLGKASYVRDALSERITEADLIVVEDFATTYAQVAFSMGYLHCLLDELVDHHKIIKHKIPPSSLKKWATNNGNANKDMMLSTAIRSGSPANNNDEADAWWLFAMGAQIAGAPILPDTKYRTVVLGKLRITTPTGDTHNG